jgi:beta-N-acetylhexosaminidase
MIKRNITLGLFLLFAGCNPNQPTSRVDKINHAEVNHTIQPTKRISHEKPLQQEVSLDEKIGSMLMVGFMGLEAKPDSQICQDIRNYHLGGVILFDVNPLDRRKPKNFESKEQVRTLTSQLQSCSHDGKLLIAVDQEGGRVQRLKSKYGFAGDFKKAKDISTLSDEKVESHYQKMARELRSVGINYNLAPDVDLAINPKNRVIYQLGRSFGSTPEQVVHYSRLFIEKMREEGILTSAKHFPGHGSSLGDTHKGFVDVSRLWQKKELKPYIILNQEGVLDTVMVAHVFNQKIDDQYPATLSKKTIKGLLREEIGFDGVVITDDLQMGAIAHKYGLNRRLSLAIGAGNDILLFGNQLSAKSMVRTERLVNTIKDMIGKEIDPNDIDQAYQHIMKLKERL